MNNLYDNATNFNVQQFMADLEKLPPAYADKIRAAFEASQKHKTRAKSYTQLTHDPCHP